MAADETQEVRSQKKVAVVYPSGVNVRKTPGMTSPILFVAPVGTIFPAKGDSGEWTRVLVPYEYGRYGYIKTEYLKDA